MTAVVTPQAGTVSLRAIPFNQRGHKLFVGVGPVEDLLKIGEVDHYNSSLESTDPEQGYQRPPERSRITRIGAYLLNDTDQLFPTAVLLAARKPLRYDDRTGRVFVPAGAKLQIVDGQHRLYGFRYLLDEKHREEFADFQVPFVIMETPERVLEMSQFSTINGTAKSVRTDLVNAILTALVAARGDDAIKSRDLWRVVVTRAVDMLDKKPASPWHNLILMPDESGSPRGTDNGKVVRATSFMTSLKGVYDWLQEFGFFERVNRSEEQAEYMYKILVEYWTALAEVVPEAFKDPNQYVIQKTPGLFSLHKLLVKALLPDMFRGHQEWAAENFVKFLKDSPEIADPNFWNRGAGRASAYGSMKGFDELFGLLKESISPRP